MSRYAKGIISLLLVMCIMLGGNTPYASASEGIKLSRAYYAGMNADAESFLITLEFDAGGLQTLDPYAYTQFYVTVDGGSRVVKSAMGGDRIVMLTVSGSVEAKQHVAVTYYPGGHYQLSDKDGRYVMGFVEYAISMGADWTRPEVESITASGRSVTLSFNKDIDMSAKYETYQFIIRADQVPQIITLIYVTQRAIMFHLDKPIDEKSIVTVSYAGGQPPLLDTSGNSVDLFYDAPAVNQSKSASLISASFVDNKLELTFNKPIFSSLLLHGAFQVRVNGKYTGITDGKTKANTVILTLYDAIKANDQLTVSYNNKSYGALETNDGMAVNSFKDYKVIRSSGNGNGGTTGGETPGTDTPITNSGNEQQSSTAAAAVAAIDPSYAHRTFGTSPAGLHSGVYTLHADNLDAAFDIVHNKNAHTSEVTFTVPDTEPAALVAYPLATVEAANKRSSKTAIVIHYKDLTLRVPLDSLNHAWLTDRMHENGGQGHLLIELDGPARGIAPQLTNKLNDNDAEISVQPIHLAMSYLSGNIKTAHPELTSNIAVEAGVDSKLNANSTATVHIDAASGRLTYIPTKIKHEAGRSKLLFFTKGFGAFAGVTGSRAFADTHGHWAAVPIGQLTQKFIMDGRTADTFEPNAPITRGEFAAYVARGLGLTGNLEAAAAFKDLRKHNNAAFIGAAVRAGIVKGISAASFDPNANITREQMAVMLMRAMQTIDPVRYASKNSENELRVYRDRGQISSWAVSDAAAAVKYGLLRGVKPDLFSPRSLASRAEASAMLLRLLTAVGYISE